MVLGHSEEVHYWFRRYVYGRFLGDRWKMTRWDCTAVLHVPGMTLTKMSDK